MCQCMLYATGGRYGTFLICANAIPLGKTFKASHSGTCRMSLRTMAKCLKIMKRVGIVSMASSTGLLKSCLRKQSTDFPKHVEVMVSRPTQRNPSERFDECPALWSCARMLQNVSS